jgi:hypothetical protein
VKCSASRTWLSYQTLRTPIEAAEITPRPLPLCLTLLNPTQGLLDHICASECYPTLLQSVRELRGESLLVMSDQANIYHPAIGPQLSLYLVEKGHKVYESFPVNSSARCTT